MVYSESLSRRAFLLFNYMFLLCMALLCLLPFIHVIAISFSSSTMASAGLVKLWPIGLNSDSYEFVLSKPEFMRALGVTFERVVLGTAINMILTVLIAYPLSKESSAFAGRTLYVWIFVFTMLFSGGLIPWYIMIKETGLMDTIWALIITSAVPVFNVVLLLNFFRGLPKELEEAAFIDGAGHLRTLWEIYVPLSMPALATLILFTVVGHWNSWFDGLILINRPENYPLQSYLQTVVIQRSFDTITLQDALDQANVSDRTIKAAQIFLGALPILLLYPFLQKFFIKGIVLGSVKE